MNVRSQKHSHPRLGNECVCYTPRKEQVLSKRSSVGRSDIDRSLQKGEHQSIGRWTMADDL